MVNSILLVLLWPCWKVAREMVGRVFSSLLGETSCGRFVGETCCPRGKGRSGGGVYDEVEGEGLVLSRLRRGRDHQVGEIIGVLAE